MKKSRTKYSKGNKKFYKLINEMKGVNDDNFLNLIKSHDKQLNDMANIHSIKSFSEFSYENIFIETEELYAFLRDTKVITNGDISAQLYASIQSRAYSQLEKLDAIGDTRELRTYNFMIYGPINVINTALAVTLYTTDRQMERPESNDIISKDFFFQNKQFPDHFLKNSLCWADKLNSHYIPLTEKEFSKNIRTGWQKKDLDDFNVIVNLLFYMNAFPDYVYDGVPKKSILDSVIFHKKRITIAPNTKFFENLKKMPHLRRGHFRTYSSDYFTNMKGKTKWIEPIFVKRKSITVEDGISM